ncbi:MAG: xanthine dehydrogenase family protein subunit M [Acidobacteriota bacterium]
MSVQGRVYQPATVDEAYGVLSDTGGGARILAGGTDLMVLINARQLPPPKDELIDIWGLDELREIEEEGAWLRFGALATWSHIVNSELAKEFAPTLIEAARTIGAIQIQNRGTIGGNVVNASPAGDSLPVLAAFDAEIEVGSSRGTRRIGFNEFYTGYRKTVLAADEMVIAVRLPKMRSDEQAFFFKVGTRRAQAISKVVMSSRVRVVDGIIESITLGLGSVAPTVIRALRTEALLKEKRLSQELVAQARTEIAAEISAITDLRSTEHYRRTVTGNLVGRILRHVGGSPLMR